MIYNKVPPLLLVADEDAAVAMLTEATTEKNESAKVHAWRLLKLVRDGCPLALAEEILR